MYCKKCGGQISEDAQFCPYCGEPQFNRDSQTGNTYRETTPEERKKYGQSSKNYLGLAGFIVSLVAIVFMGLVVAIVGLVLSLVAYRRRNQYSDYNTLAKAGVIIGIVALAIWLIVFIVALALIVAA
ncbi:MAG: zinc-ribbon domain-containing protein [Coprobacillus sp.]|nr:zinc-ribbon domain-containing protein [Coprobacillus sp.]